MHRDPKIGIAVGVALVGIVAALFFRRDPAPEEPAPPALEGAGELDKKIADKSKAPYIDGLDEFPDPPAAPAQNASARPKAKPGAYELPGFLTKQDQAEHQAILSSQQTAAPDPIAPASTEKKGPRDAANVPTLPPAHNRDWEPTGPGSSQPGAPRKSTAAGGEAGAARRTHVTQSGDTLSGLAARYLGSSSRFRELYEANRTVLRSPDDLPDGVTLVIPEAGRTNGTTSPPAATAGSGPSPKMHQASSVRSQPVVETSEPAVSGNAAPEKVRFAPVRRGAYSAGRTLPGTQAAP
jgi:nucleoid-associated protein YgaU